MSEYRLNTGKVGEKVTAAYQKIEDGVVGTYQKMEDGVVGAYKKVEDAFVDKFLEKVNEEKLEEIDVEEAREQV